MTLVELMPAARSHRDRCLIVLYYVSRKENTPSLYTREVADRLGRARVPRAAKINVSDILNRAGNLVDGEHHPGKGRHWKLTGTGTKVVEDLLREYLTELPFVKDGIVVTPPEIAEIRLLFVGVSPTDTDRLRLDEEHREIQERIRASKHRDCIRFVSSWAVRPDDMFQLLHEHKPHIVHFSGHGTSHGGLSFEGAAGEARAVPSDAFSSLFEAMNDNVKLVVLNACHSAVAAQKVAAHVDCAIGMNDAINDATAIHFSAALYRSIGFGRSLLHAFREARASIVMEGLPGDSVPQLFERNTVDAARIVLAKEPQ